MKFYFSFILLLCFRLYAQDEGAVLHAKNHKYYPEYRINYFDKMIFKIDLNSDVDNYSIPNLNRALGDESKFVPNQKTKLRFSFDYKFLGLFISYSPNFYAKDESVYGETKTLDLSFKFFYTDRLRQEVDFKNTRGFYVESPLQSTPLDVYPQLEIRTIGGKTFYIMNNNFSYRAFENMTERQVRNAGSFIPSIGYYFNKLKSKRVDENEKSLLKVYSFDALFQYGYMHNFILSRKWFATLGAHPGFGLNNSRSYYYEKATDEQTIIKSLNMNFNLDLNLALGYNNKNLFGGFKVNFRDYQYDNSKTAELINSKLYIDFFVGYRFKENKKIKKVFELLEKKIF
ncbi:DUF4421 family protein [Flavobacterium sp. NRK F7]|uniref:DUF4421 family protein n=1 Tax=Flavobacterium sp. NRK F7 TaxID=2954930 RepID=UPI0035AE350B